MLAKVCMPNIVGQDTQMDASEYETEDGKNSCEWGKIALSPLSRKALYKNRLPCNKMISSPTVGFRVILTVHCAEKLLKAEKQGDWKFVKTFHLRGQSLSRHDLQL